MAKAAAIKPESAPPMLTLSDPFARFGRNNQWIVLGLLLLMGFVVFNEFLRFDALFFYKDIASDSINFNYSVLAHNTRYTAAYGFPSWSFEFGMGQNAFIFTLFDPLDYLLYPLGLEKARALMGYKVFFEVVLSGFIFYHFLRKLQLQYLTAILGALMYAFSGFMIVSSSWFIFSVEVLTLALLLLSFEMIYQKNQYWLFPLPIIYIILSRPFVLATLALFMLTYITLRHLQDGPFQARKYFITLGQVVLAGLVGLLIAAPFLLEHLQIMLESPRGSGANALSGQLKAKPMFEVADKLQLGTAICRTFASDILGSGTQFKGWLNLLEAPAFYCGLPALLLIPQLFSQAAKRMRWIYVSFLLIWIIPVIFPYFRYAFSFFTGDYYRSFSFYVSTVLILLALWGLDTILQKQKISLPALGIAALLSIIMLLYPYFEEDIRVSAILSMVFLLLSVYAILLFMAGKGQTKALLALAVVLVLELTYFSRYALHNERDYMTQADMQEKKGFNDHTTDALAFIKKSDSNFYRIDKRYASSPAMHASLNDAMAQGYFGTSCYHSFNQKGYIQYLKTLQVISDTLEVETRWAPGLSSRGILEGVNSVKYMLTKAPIDPMSRMIYDSMATFGDVQVFRHKFALPLGYAHDRVMRLSDFKKCSPFQKDFLSLKTAVVEDEDLSKLANMVPFNLADTLQPTGFTLDTINAWHAQRNQHTFQISRFEPAHFSGKIVMPCDGMVYFSIPFDEGWFICEQGKELDKFLLSHGMMGVYLKAGEHTLDFDFRQVSADRGKKLSWAGLALFGLLIFLSIKTKKDAAV
jgi:hypothetical protein